MRIDVYHHYEAGQSPAPDPRIDQVIALLQTVMTGISEMSMSMDAEIAQLRTDITGLTTTVQNAVAEFGSFAGRLQDAITAALAAGATPEQLAAMTQFHADITTAQASLAAAITSEQEATHVTPPAPPAEPTP